jgi:hypothetical protein
MVVFENPQNEELNTGSKPFRNIDVRAATITAMLCPLKP